MKTSRSEGQSTLRFVELSPLQSPRSQFSDSEKNANHPVFKRARNVYAVGKRLDILETFSPQNQDKFLLPLDRIMCWKRNVQNSEKLRQKPAHRRTKVQHKMQRVQFEAPYSPRTFLSSPRFFASRSAERFRARLLIKSLQTS